jgi:hypothetical protein
VEPLMEERLSNLDVWIWRYRSERRGYRGYHFAASPVSCQALIDSVAEMQRSSGDTRRSIPLRTMALPADPVGIDDPFDLLQKLVIAVVDDAPLRVAGDRQTVMLTVSRASAAELTRALTAVQAFGGDFALEGQSDLWFWPAVWLQHGTRR